MTTGVAVAVVVVACPVEAGMPNENEPPGFIGANVVLKTGTIV